MKKLKECSEEEIKLAISGNKNLGQVCKQLQCIDNTYNRNKLKEFIKLNDLDIGHFVVKQNLESYNKNPKVCKIVVKLFLMKNVKMIFVVVPVQLVIIIREQ